MASQPLRNTTTHRRCPKCEGAGELVFNNTNPHGYGPDPQCDEVAPCPAPACIAGWIRFSPIDALEILAHERRQLRRMPRTRYFYDKARAEAMRPVRLPADRQPASLCVELLGHLSERESRRALLSAARPQKEAA